MTDAEIERELGHSITEDEPLEIVDAEIVEETPNLPAVIAQPWNGAPVEDQSREKREYAAKPGRTPDGRSTNAENVASYESSLANDPQRRCVATNTKGERCRKFAIFGATVCRTHGGSAPHVVNKARIRVEMASNRLMGKLIEFAFDDTKPPGAQLDAIKDSLNRAGLKPREQVEIGPMTAHEEIFTDITSGSRAESRRARGIEEPETIAAESLSVPPPHPPGPSETYDFEPEPPWPDSDYGTPAATQPRERGTRDASQRRGRPNGSGAVTGDDALRIAAELRGLPPGRSSQI